MRLKVILLIAFGVFLISAQKKGEAMVEKIAGDIKWLGHASIFIKLEGKSIYIDPWEVKSDLGKADIILVTHSHYDHYSEEDIKRISKQDTFIYSSSDVISQTSLKNKKVIKPFDELKIGNITLKGFPAYNIDKDFHPKKNDWLGFIIESGGVSIYIAGDTDFIPEMKKIKVNIAIVPVGGTYTMNAEQAADFINTIKPDIAIPIHWGRIVGSKKDAEKFKALVKPPTKVIVK